MNRPHILILSAGPACKNPRPAKEARSLREAGYTVTYMARVFNPRLQQLDEQLTREGGYIRHVVPEDSRLSRKLLTWLARQLSRTGLGSVHALGEHRRLLNAAQAHPADLIIAHSEVPLWVGRRLLRQGRLVAADLEDWHSEDLLPSARRHRPLRLLRTLERDLLREAAFCTTPSGVMADALHRRYGGTRATVLTNSFPLQPRPDPGSRQGPPTLFWYSQTLGSGRGLEPFIQAWGEIPGDSRLVLLGMPVAGFPEHLLSLVPPGRRNAVSFLSPVPPGELPGLIARHDIGLALEESTPENRRLALTNKILQYLNAGLAVVASDTAGQREVFARNPGIGALISLQSPESVRQGLLPLLSSGEALLNARIQARALAEAHYNWEREARCLLDLVGRALAGRRGKASQE